MKKRHVYDLVILLAAGTIMMSACGKKPDAPADTTAPTQTESQTEASAEETTKPDETPSETQVPEDTESTKFYMLQGTVTKAEKDGSAFTLLADDGNEYTIALSDIRDVETEIEKNIQIAIACMKDAHNRYMMVTGKCPRRNRPIPINITNTSKKARHKR